MPDRDRAEFRPMRESSVWIALVIVLLLLGAGALWWRWSHQPAPVAEPPPMVAPAPQPDAPPPEPVATGPEHPIETPPEAPLSSLASSDAQVGAALDQLLGRKAMAMLQLDNVVRRVVATVDNLPREKVSMLNWPVQPTAGRFTVEGEGEVKTVAADNGARYTPFVLLVESADTAKTVALYRRFYPLFQSAYEDLGYPGRYFNDRLVAVIDHLLQAPEPQGPLRVQLPPVKTEVDVPMTRPWVRYEFDDPQLEALSAGQKIMVRVGPVNERRLKAKLAALREQVATVKP